MYSLFSSVEEKKSNLDILYPVFPSVMILTRAIISELDIETRGLVFNELRRLITNDSYITQVPVNLSYAIRILAHDKSEETDFALSKSYKSEDNPIIRADIILAMAQRDCDYWISDKLKSYSSLSRWEKRSLLISSYILRDEGEHWRGKVKNELPEIDILLLEWFSDRITNGDWGVVL